MFTQFWSVDFLLGQDNQLLRTGRNLTQFQPPTGISKILIYRILFFYILFSPADFLLGQENLTLGTGRNLTQFQALTGIPAPR